MFSHALVAYQLAFMDFFTKTSETFKNAMSSIDKGQHYSFTILKELTQGAPPATNEEDDSIVKKEGNGVTSPPPVDSDQMLFFKVI